MPNPSKTLVAVQSLIERYNEHLASSLGVDVDKLADAWKNMRISEKDVTLPRCIYRYKRGVFMDQQCRNHAKRNIKYCGVHEATLKREHDREVLPKCKYIKSNDARCYNIELHDGLCRIHYNFINQTVAKREPKPITTCKYVFVNGKKKNTVCGNNTLDRKYCSKHRAIGSRSEENQDSK